ncbi:MAG: methyltransferase domain-containing protein [Bacteroidetes bacterium]|nr:methyltransferase domain-containing protein [Bacteroidota bacterium]
MERKELIKRRFANGLVDYDSQSSVQRSVCEHLDELMKVHLPELNSNVAVELGAGTGFFTSYLIERYQKCEWYLNDIVEQVKPFLDDIINNVEPNLNVEYCWGDAEKLPLPENISLLASSSVFQWFDDFKSFLERVYPKISVGGYVVFSSFGEDNFFQIRSASNNEKGFKFPDFDVVAEWCKLAGFEIIKSEKYNEKIYFETPHEMLKYIKDTGVCGSSDGHWSRKQYFDFCKKYEISFKENNLVYLTYNPILFILKKQ